MKKLLITLSILVSLISCQAYERNAYCVEKSYTAAHMSNTTITTTYYAGFTPIAIVPTQHFIPAEYKIYFANRHGVYSISSDEKTFYEFELGKKYKLNF